MVRCAPAPHRTIPYSSKGPGATTVWLSGVPHSLPARRVPSFSGCLPAWDLWTLRSISCSAATTHDPSRGSRSVVSVSATREKVAVHACPVGHCARKPTDSGALGSRRQKIRVSVHASPPSCA